MRYVIAWALAGSVVYGGFVAYSNFKNPWAVHQTSVLDVLPPAGAGCGKDCAK